MEKGIKKFLLIVLIVILGLIGVLTGKKFISNESRGIEVLEIIDGDTIKVKNEDGKTFNVRYMGIDTPELDGPSYKTCFAEEALSRNQDLVLGKKILLEYDIDKYDQFGRVLAYVWTLNENGDKDIFVNLELLKQGLARFYLDKTNTLKQDELIQAEIEAQESFLGLWGSCGDFEGKCIIKGNIDRLGNKYYHLPGDKYYESTVVNLDKEDKWFCTIEEAEASNFERANADDIID